MTLYALILAVLTIILVVIAAKTDILRNEIFNQANFLALAAAKGITNPRAAFSLGKSQFAFWSVIIISSFIFLVSEKSLVNFQSPVINQVNLILLGIAAGTTVVAKVIDGSQKDDQGESIPQQDYPSKNFLTDILSDEKGVSIHRLQNVLWTVTVGVIYVSYVFANSKLPDDTVITINLLTLMGISTGAYLGLKTTENKATADNTPTSTTTTDPVVQKPALDTSNSAQHDL